MICAKTGCNAYLHEYGEWVYGDAHLTQSGHLIIRVAGRSHHGPLNGMKHRHYEIYTTEEWWDQNNQYSTLYVGSGYVFHDYDGKPESECMT
jgi:hypothetical protein